MMNPVQTKLDHGSVQQGFGSRTFCYSLVHGSALVNVTELEQNRFEPGLNHGLWRANGVWICPKWMTDQLFLVLRLMNNNYIRYLLVVTRSLEELLILVQLLSHFPVFP